MDRIAWDMRYGLPNQQYLEFITRYVLKVEGEWLVDPLSPDISPSEHRNVYIERKDVEKELTRWESQIILGPPGSGKTTLSRALRKLWPDKVLVVYLPLAEIGIPVSDQEWLDGKFSPLSPAYLAHYIFDAYWEDRIRHDHNWGRYKSELSQKLEWVGWLRCFYYRCTPLHPQGPADLMKQLCAEAPHPLLSPQASPRDLLRELVRFVADGRICVSVIISIDGVESLSAPAAARLLHDIQGLHDLYLEHMSFKLFADPILQAQVEAMPCVREGRVGLYVLPPWREEEMCELLNGRIKNKMDGQPFSAPIELSDRYFTRPAQAQLFELIARGALRGEQEGRDAPLHALRLARGVFAAAAGCWSEFPAPLTIDQIADLIARYWQTEEEKK